MTSESKLNSRKADANRLVSAERDSVLGERLSSRCIGISVLVISSQKLTKPSMPVTIDVHSQRRQLSSKVMRGDEAYVGDDEHLETSWPTPFQ